MHLSSSLFCASCSRLYTRQNFENDMEEFEPGEIRRIPLDNVILLLRTVLSTEDDVTETLLSTLEPPDLTTIAKSFANLFRNRFISSPSSDCSITTLGKLASALGIDLSLSSLIGLGIQFGVGPEAIFLAGVLSFNSPWVISNPLVHEPREFNGTKAVRIYAYEAKCHVTQPLITTLATFRQQ